MINTFLLLAANILPLFGLIALGYIGGRWLDVHLQSLATVAIYLVAPIVNFGAMARMHFDAAWIALPFLVLAMSTSIGIITWKAAQARWKGPLANLVAMSSVTGNTGYFGLPLVMALFGPDWAGIYLFMNVALVLSEIGLGYYFGARGHADIKGALKKVARLPIFYAVLAGLAFNMTGWTLPEAATRYWTYATGAWVFIGMMLMGVALGRMEKLEIDFRLATWLLVPKFILWPLAGFVVVMADMMIFDAFPTEVRQMILIFTAVPLAGNLVAYAVNLNLHPERAAPIVLASTVLALITIPTVLAAYNLLI